MREGRKDGGEERKEKGREGGGHHDPKLTPFDLTYERS